MDTPQEKEAHTEVTPIPAPAVPARIPEVTTTGVVATPFYKKHQALIAFIFGVVIVLAGYYVYTTQYAKGEAVAVVNGGKIYATEFNESLTLLEQSATLQGLDITEATVKDELKKQALNILVDNALLLGAAKNAGFTVTDEEREATYTQLVTEFGGEEGLKTRMGEVGLTEEKLQSNIEDRLLTDQYIKSETDIEGLSVSDEEVTEFIKALGAPEGELPPIEEIRPQIEAQILGQKQQQIVLDLLAKLRAEATIEIRI